MGVAEAEKRMGREDSGHVVSLDLTGEPFRHAHDFYCGARWGGNVCDCQMPSPQRMGSDNSGGVVEYRRCSNGHIDIWYDSTDSDKCPLCAVRERE